jgi:hypothetical protein
MHKYIYIVFILINSKRWNLEIICKDSNTKSTIVLKWEAFKRLDVELIEVGYKSSLQV